LVARVQLADRARLPALQADARELAARFDREITDGYERQAVIATAAWMLEQAALPDESDALLKANLAKSHSPYYLMSDLADNAKKRGDAAAALDWSAQAFDKSEGAATRLQWGVSHLRLLVELAPQDAARIEAVAARIIDEAAAQPDAFEARSGRSMQRIGKLLADWDPMGERAEARRRLQQRLDAVCAKLPAGSEARATCDGALKSGAAS
ncbi:MAG: disulfide isomerase, partial [Pseudomonadota bacterium]